MTGRRAVPRNNERRVGARRNGESPFYPGQYLVHVALLSRFIQPSLFVQSSVADPA